PACRICGASTSATRRPIPPHRVRASPPRWRESGSPRRPGRSTATTTLGMKQRLGLAAALLKPRQLLILDEPTNGLDPQGTREVRKLVRDLATDGTTVLVSSHLLSEIEQIATHVGMMSAGRLVRQGTLDEVLADGAPQLRLTTPDLETARLVLGRLGLGETSTDAGHDVITAR